MRQNVKDSLPILLFQVNTITQVAQWYEKCYRSIDMGEAFVKEMLFSSIFGVPLSVKSTIIGYQLMQQRVNSVATGLNLFTSLSLRCQKTLIKYNTDLMVSLHVAYFFGIKRKGLDQIVIAMGIDDCNVTSAKKMIMDLKNQRINKLQYSLCNSLQKIDTTSPTEIRYNLLLEKVGSTLRLVNESLGSSLRKYIFWINKDCYWQGKKF